MKSSFETALVAPKASLFIRAGILGLLASAFVPLSQAYAAGDTVAGEQKAHTCLGCHGVQHYVNTYPTYHVPLISGQHEAYLVAALQAYRAKTRSHPTMQANAALLTDQDIADIAAWLSAQGAK
ncbi:MAG: cytochrome c553 [Granulosicoccus sp.]|jgi:cytochrome c553